MTEQQTEQELTEPIEYQAWHNIDPPTCFQRAKAIIPPSICLTTTIAVLYMAFMGYDHEYLRVSSTITTVAGGSVIILTSVIGWMIKYHPDHELINMVMEWNIKASIPYVIFACAFHGYIKNGGDITSYYIWVCMHTTLIMMISASPFIVKLFHHS